MQLIRIKLESLKKTLAMVWLKTFWPITKICNDMPVSNNWMRNLAFSTVQLYWASINRNFAEFRVNQFLVPAWCSVRLLIAKVSLDNPAPSLKSSQSRLSGATISTRWFDGWVSERGLYFNGLVETLSSTPSNYKPLRYSWTRSLNEV